MLLAKTIQPTQPVTWKHSPVVISDRPFTQLGLASQTSDLPATSDSILPVGQHTGPFTQSTISKKTSVSVHQQWSLPLDWTPSLPPARRLPLMLNDTLDPVISQWPLTPDWSASTISDKTFISVAVDASCLSVTGSDEMPALHPMRPISQASLLLPSGWYQ